MLVGRLSAWRIECCCDYIRIISGEPQHEDHRERRCRQNDARGPFPCCRRDTRTNRGNLRPGSLGHRRLLSIGERMMVRKLLLASTMLAIPLAAQAQAQAPAG